MIVFEFLSLALGVGAVILLVAALVAPERFR